MNSAPAVTLPASPVRLGWPARLALLTLAGALVAAVLWPRMSALPPAPRGTLAASDGSEVKIEKALAPVTLVHFWATWCPPCVDEIPAISALARDLALEPRFSLVMVAVADPKDKVEKFLGGAEAARPVLYDAEWEVAHRYGTRKLPETYLVVDGRIAQKFEGATDWSHPEIREMIRKALAQA